MSRNYDTNLSFATSSKIRVTKLRHECLCCNYEQNSCHKITTRMFVLPLQNKFVSRNYERIFVLPLRAKFVSQNYDTNVCVATTSKIRVTKLRHECLLLQLQEKFVSRNYDTNLSFATSSNIRVTKLRHESLSCHYQQHSCHKITTRIFVLPLHSCHKITTRIIRHSKVLTRQRHVMH